MTDFAAPIHRRLTARAPEPPRAEANARHDWRLMLLILAFLLFYAAVAGRMAWMALSDPVEPRLGATSPAEPVRGAITDRAGRLIAANLPAWSLYAHPSDVLNPVQTAARLGEILPDMEADEILALLTSRRKFVWIKRPITPRQKAAIQDLGNPGLLFGARDLRLYPPGPEVAHVVGGVQAEREAVRYAALRGQGGVERFFDRRLSDPALSGEPLALSLDLSVQAALRDVLETERRRTSAIGAAGVLMRVQTGEVIALVSLPDFDPNRPRRAPDRAAGKSPRFNRAVQGLYELGSVFKPLTVAMALERGLVAPQTLIDTRGPLRVGRQRINDDHPLRSPATVTDIIRKSSNVGTGRIARMVTAAGLQADLRKLGFGEPVPIELAEAPRVDPLWPPKWREISTLTVSFGHGIAVSPLHLAAAYATLGNGGMRVRPTLVKGGVEREAERVFSERTARRVLDMLRLVVTDGTGRRAAVEGYEIGGKTGTADKPRENGRGYDHTRTIATFASVFPVSRPEYVLVVSMDEPTDRSGRRPSRQASRTAAPAVAAAVRRIAPILGMAPREREIEMPGEALPAGVPR
ncbi:MAG: penicillin-binding protein 2 [Pseudomonadota bacterium]